MMMCQICHPEWGASSRAPRFQPWLGTVNNHQGDLGDLPKHAVNDGAIQSGQ